MPTRRMDGVEPVEGSACPDRMRMCLRIAPKHGVSSVVGKLKGKSATIPREGRPGRRRPTCGDGTLRARGRYVGAVGLNESVIRRYIRKQEEGGRIEQAKGRRQAARRNGRRPVAAMPPQQQAPTGRC